MGEEGSISHSCSESTQTVHEEHMFKQESDAVCTVILESEDVTFIPILPVEAGEEVVLYEDMQDVKVEIDVCSDGYQNIYSEGYAQQSIGSLVSNPRSKSSRQGLHKCKTCGKTFTQVPNLVTHERIHTGEKPFKCSVCMKPFSQQPNLWKHMRIHTGERPYQCGTCKKCFTQQANLTKHTRIHTGERPYACQYCGKCFTQQANLTKHVRLHTGERPFHCRFCTKSFVQQSNLERHERTHTGVKPFKCKLCCDSFAQNAHLAKHVRSIHKMVKPIQSVYQIKEELTPVNSTVQSKQITSGDKFDNSKKYGIPVLICTKTGRIIKRLD